MKVWRRENGNLNYWCPACQRYHWVSCSHWIMLGSPDDPTVVPAFTFEGKARASVCHHMISHGRLYYFEDSSHELRGKWVDMQELPASPVAQLSFDFIEQ